MEKRKLGKGYSGLCKKNRIDGRKTKTLSSIKEEEKEQIPDARPDFLLKSARDVSTTCKIEDCDDLRP